MWNKHSFVRVCKFIYRVILNCVSARTVAICDVFALTPKII